MNSIGLIEAAPTRYRFSSRVVPPLAFFIELAALLAAVPVALGLYSVFVGGGHNVKVHVAAVSIAAVAFFLVRVSRDAYSNPLARVRDADQGVISDYIIAALLSITTVWQFGMSSLFSRGLTAFYIGTALLFLFLGRFLLRHIIWRLAQSGHIAQRVVIFGASPEPTHNACRLLELERLPHLKIVGVADERGSLPPRDAAITVPFLGNIDAILTLARAGEIDQVLIALPELTQERLDEIVEALSAVAIDISVIPREALVLSSNYKVHFIGSAPVLSLWQRPARDFDAMLKWLEDKSLALVGLILLAPLLLLTAVAIKLTSRGPILFVQKRFGFNNVEINVLKFRSMYIDRQDVSGGQRTTKRDQRVTPIGRFIRRFSIDELPQLWNVLRGDMSIVGPRPHATAMKVEGAYYFDAVRGYAARHRVKPGLTGLAQIRGLRGEIDSLEKARLRVEHDRFYIDNWSLMLDFHIIAATVFRVIVDRNAY